MAKLSDFVHFVHFLTSSVIYFEKSSPNLGMILGNFWKCSIFSIWAKWEIFCLNYLVTMFIIPMEVKVCVSYATLKINSSQSYRSFYDPESHCYCHNDWKIGINTMPSIVCRYDCRSFTWIATLYFGYEMMIADKQRGLTMNVNARNNLLCFNIANLYSNLPTSEYR